MFSLLSAASRSRKKATSLPSRLSRFALWESLRASKPKRRLGAQRSAPLCRSPYARFTARRPGPSLSGRRKRRRRAARSRHRRGQSTWLHASVSLALSLSLQFLHRSRSRCRRRPRGPVSSGSGALIPQFAGLADTDGAEGFHDPNDGGAGALPCRGPLRGPRARDARVFRPQRPRCGLRSGCQVACGRRACSLGEWKE